MAENHEDLAAIVADIRYAQEYAERLVNDLCGSLPSANSPARRAILHREFIQLLANPTRTANLDKVTRVVALHDAEAWLGGPVDDGQVWLKLTHEQGEYTVTWAHIPDGADPAQALIDTCHRGVARASAGGDGDVSAHAAEAGASSAAPKMRDYLYPDSLTFGLKEDEIIDGFRWLGGMPATPEQRPILKKVLDLWPGHPHKAFIQLEPDECAYFIDPSNRFSDLSDFPDWKSVWVCVIGFANSAYLTVAYVPPLVEPGEALRTGTLRLFGHFPLTGDEGADGAFTATPPDWINHPGMQNAQAEPVNELPF